MAVTELYGPAAKIREEAEKVPLREEPTLATRYETAPAAQEGMSPAKKATLADFEPPKNVLEKFGIYREQG